MIDNKLIYLSYTSLKINKGGLNMTYSELFEDYLDYYFIAYIDSAERLPPAQVYAACENGKACLFTISDESLPLRVINVKMCDESFDVIKHRLCEDYPDYYYFNEGFFCLSDSTFKELERAINK